MEQHLGPLTTKEGFNRVEEYVEEAKSRSAETLLGRRKPSGAEFEKGYFFDPTILVNVDHTMKLVKNETFGPMVPIMPFKTFDEVIEEANDTEYGLVSYIYTGDLGKILTTFSMSTCF